MEINEAWKSTCRTVLGREIGELSKYDTYLKEAVQGMTAVSAFSRKPLSLASRGYSPKARFFDYATEQKLASGLNTPFPLDAIKDIDSLTSLIRERMLYAADKTQGACQEIHSSDMVVDSLDIYDSANIARCKHVKCGYNIRDCECIFGGASFGLSSHLIRCCYSKNLSRLFECAFCDFLSDSLFCYNTFNSSDCLFTFHARNKRHMVANVQLDKARYAASKARLLEQITGELESRGRLDFSIIDLLRVN